jgi:hypothetical protein
MPQVRSKYVVREHRPGFIPAVVIGGVVLWLLVAAFIWWFTKHYVVADRDQLADEVRALQAELTAVQEAVARIPVLERQVQVKTTAEAQLRNDLAEQSAVIEKLRGELAFYERLIGSGGQDEGLTVHSLYLSATDSPNVFRYRLILAQNIQRASVVSGDIQWRLEGVRDGASIRLNEADLFSGDDETPLRFTFKYFEHKEGLLMVPEGVEPELLTIRLDPNRGDNVENRFEFTQLLGTL